MTSVFLDTDVILDLFIEREPHHSVALRFFSYLQVHADSIQAYTSPVVIANVGYSLGKARSEAYGVQKIKGLRDFMRILPMTEAVTNLQRPCTSRRKLSPYSLKSLFLRNGTTGSVLPRCFR